jgi:hypothetical protein
MEEQGKKQQNIEQQDNRLGEKEHSDTGRPSSGILGRGTKTSRILVVGHRAA